MSEAIRLADWIAALRRELTEAIRWQEGREAAHRAEALPMLVPSLKLKELKVEVELMSSREEGSKTQASAGAKAGAKSAIAFFVVSGEVSGGISGNSEQRQSNKFTQRVTLLLEPGEPVYLGDDGEREMLADTQ